MIMNLIVNIICEVPFLKAKRIRLRAIPARIHSKSKKSKHFAPKGDGLGPKFSLPSLPRQRRQRQVKFRPRLRTACQPIRR